MCVSSNGETSESELVIIVKLVKVKYIYIYIYICVGNKAVGECRLVCVGTVYYALGELKSRCIKIEISAY